LAASDSTIGGILLFSLAMSLGVASILGFYWDLESLFFIYIGWPLLIPGTLFNGGWGLLIIPLIGIILWGWVFAEWNPYLLFAWSIFLGAFTALAAYGYEADPVWVTPLILLPPGILLAYVYSPLLRKKPQLPESDSDIHFDAPST
ncbi:MAG: hypothetical protein PF795_03355, partial [Kiritimatiellae bacterium]|nr:hypothetical protein [Kiritimatiellia bacterium]